MGATVLELQAGLLIASDDNLLEVGHLVGVGQSSQILHVGFWCPVVAVLPEHHHQLHPIGPAVVVTFHRAQYNVVCCQYVVVVMVDGERTGRLG